jgi:hypothetical protein
MHTQTRQDKIRQKRPTDRQTDQTPPTPTLCFPLPTPPHPHRFPGRRARRPPRSQKQVWERQELRGFDGPKKTETQTDRHTYVIGPKAVFPISPQTAKMTDNNTKIRAQRPSYPSPNSNQPTNQQKQQQSKKHRKKQKKQNQRQHLPSHCPICPAPPPILSNHRKLPLTNSATIRFRCSGISFGP